MAFHLTQRKMGSDGARDCMMKFSAVQTALGAHKQDPRIGILLITALDEIMGHYHLGFYRISVSHIVDLVSCYSV